MAWDKKGYYYRGKREGDRVHRIYVGRGPHAERAAAEDEARQAERRSRAAAARAAEAWQRPLHDQVRQFAAMTELLVRAALLAAGYHYCDRTTWRRRLVKRELNADAARPSCTRQAG